MDRADKVEPLLPDEKMYSIVRLDYWYPPFHEDAAVKTTEKDTLDGETDAYGSKGEKMAYDRYGRVYELPEDEEGTPIYTGRVEDLDTPEPPEPPEYPDESLEADIGDVIQIVETERHSPLVRQTAAKKMAKIAEEDPSEAIDYVPRAVTLLDDEDQEVVEKAALFLAKVGEEYPEEMKPSVTELTQVQDEREVFVAVSNAIGTVVKEYPSVGLPFVDVYFELLDHSSNRIRNNALAMLVDIAEDHPDAVKERIPEYVELLEDEDKYVRYNAVSVLARIAKREPDAVRENDSIDQEYFVDMLSSEHEPMRENSCWLLGYIGAVEAIPEMERVKKDDESESVREAADASIENARLRDQE